MPFHLPATEESFISRAIMDIEPSPYNIGGIPEPDA